MEGIPLLIEEIRLTSWYGESLIIYDGFYRSQVVSRISAINSMVLVLLLIIVWLQVPTIDIEYHVYQCYKPPMER